MPSLERTCPNCGHTVLWNFGETVLGERLIWHASSHCDNCGYHLEEDDRGPLPDDLRVIVLTEQGEWTLRIEDASGSRMLIIKSLREALDLSLLAVAQLKERIPGAVLSGTRAEMQRLRALLARQGISAAVVLSTN